MKLPEWLKLLKGSLEDDNDEPVDLLFSDQVSSGDRWDGITAKEFGMHLSAIPKGKRINMLINCLGGGVPEGTAIYHTAKMRPNLHTCVIGYAASMGSIIAQAGATRTMCKGTIMMVHNPAGDPGYSEAKDLEAKAAVLRTVKSGMIDIYNERTKLGKKRLSELMDATTFMGPKEALELGFIDAISDSPTATASVDPKSLFDTYRQLASAPKCAVGDDGGAIPPAKPNEQKPMKLLTETLAKLGLVSSASLTDESAIITEVNSRFAPINSAAGEVAGLKTSIQSHEAALKVRVTNRVQKAIDDKKVKPERKDSLIAIGVANETGLDFLDDIAVATPPAGTAGSRRGAPPLPASAQQPSADDRLRDIRAEMAEEKDPKALALLAIEARKLRGDGDMFAKATYTPATQAAAAAVAK